MSQTQTESKPPAADVQAALFVRMAAVVRMTGLGRSTIYRKRPVNPS
jgi:prophage regulatory protein